MISPSNFKKSLLIFIYKIDMWYLPISRLNIFYNINNINNIINRYLFNKFNLL